MSVLYRYNDKYIIPTSMPAWNWRNADKKTAYLAFPRILAHAVRLITGLQPFDGNLGLGVPGYGSPERSEAYRHLICSLHIQTAMEECAGASSHGECRNMQLDWRCKLTGIRRTRHSSTSFDTEHPMSRR